MRHRITAKQYTKRFLLLYTFLSKRHTNIFYINLSDIMFLKRIQNCVDIK